MAWSIEGGPMKHLILAALATCIAGMLTTNPARATEGALDENGCHYDRQKNLYHCHKAMPPNPDRFAPVKKSRENICHDKSSPNYRTLLYFVAYRSMQECVVSGGKEPMNGAHHGGLSDRDGF
jgi:hypothetical protein